MYRMRYAPFLAVVAGLLLAGCGEQGITDASDAVVRAPGAISALTVVSETGLSERDLSGLTAATDFETAGTGTESNNAETITVTLPAGATVEQVYLYWARRIVDPENDPPPSTVLVDATSVTGTIIGGPIETSDNKHSPTTYLADITSMGLVGAGTSSFTVEDDVAGARGASVLVFYDDGGVTRKMSLYDGVDFAWADDGAAVRQVMEPVTFSFASAGADRTAELFLFIGDVDGSTRPNELDITIDGTTTTLDDPFFAADGQEWDNFVTTLTIPAGATEVTVEPISPDDKPNAASLLWAATGLSVQPLEGGGDGCTPGYWRQEQHFDEWTAPHDPTDPFTDPGFNLPSALERPEQNTDPATLDLLDALELRGGGVNALMRHAVAALLNAANPDVSYDLTEAEVVDAFNAALAGSDSDIEAQKNVFEGFNEQSCPLD